HLVRTSDHINIQDGEKHLVDGRLIPPKAIIDAKGMEMELTTSSPPPRPGVLPSAKPKNESISGVKRIVLKEDVDMTLYVAGGGPFPDHDKTPANGGRPASEPSRTPAANASSSAEPSLIHIRTPGRFEYELFTDHDMARFDVPAGIQQSTSLQDVMVERINKKTGYDMLVCKHLELRLKRRNDAPPARTNERRDADATERRDAGATEQGAEVETAHATGPYVTLTSDAEKLDAHGTDFFHDTAKKLSVLKGTPYMEANKDESLIQAPEMRIQEIPLPAASAPPAGTSDKAANLQPKTYQQVQATGPGRIHMINKSTGKRTVHAFWNDKLVSTRDGALDLLILLGSARFVDDEHKQSLKAETLKVWLLAEDKKLGATVKAAPSPQSLPPAGKGAKSEGATAKGSAMPAPTRRPYRVEALRNVLASSPELNIHDAARLVVNFTDVPLERMPPPSSNNGNPGAPPLNNKAAAPSIAPAPRTPTTGLRAAPIADGRKPTANGQKQIADNRKPTANGQKPTANGQK
ncbi:MAG: hypothetical protein ACRELF_17525, partial [Gemmataceae bacterium]